MSSSGLDAREDTLVVVAAVAAEPPNMRPDGTFTGEELSRGSGSAGPAAALDAGAGVATAPLGVDFAFGPDAAASSMETAEEAPPFGIG